MTLQQVNKMNRKAGTEAEGDVRVDRSVITWLFVKDTGMP